MAEQKVKIVAECVCDLPQDWFPKNNVDIVYFLVETDRGVFADTNEITSDNVIEYMLSGKTALSAAPTPDVYKKVFEKNLESYGEVIHVAISSHVSLSCRNAGEAVRELGDKGGRVHIFDTGHLSSGLGHFVIKAAEMAASGCSADEILAELERLKKKVSTSFIAESVDFLYRNGRISKRVRNLCVSLDIHPILEMKNGALVCKSFTRGNYRKACEGYIKKTLRSPNKIEKGKAFITQVGCSPRMLEQIKQDISEVCRFDDLTVTRASATVSSNCGPNTFGILFIRK